MKTKMKTQAEKEKDENTDEKEKMETKALLQPKLFPPRTLKHILPRLKGWVQQKMY